jgi:hypothetical protein
MANNKDFITKNPIEVGGSTKTTIGTISSDAIQSSFDLANASYDGVVLNDGNITQARNVTFKPDGTRMYVCQNNDRVYQFDLSTAWDISTASVNGNYDPAQDSDPKDVIFNSNGTKMYIAGDQNDRTYQYSLSTAWDITSASYDSVSFNATGQTAGIFGINFNDDGTSFYIIGTPDVIYQYTLSSAYDLSTASYASKSFSVTDDDDSAGGFTFNNDGTKLFYVGYENDLVHQYSLSTAWDISTATSDGVTFSVTTQNTVPVDVTFSGDGTKMYITGFSGGDIYQYSTGVLAEELDLSTGNYFSYTPSGNTTYAFANASDAQTFQLEVTSGSYNVSDDLNDASYVAVYDKGTGHQGLYIKPDGTKYYVVSGATVTEYQMSTAWDITSSSTTGDTFTNTSYDTDYDGIWFKDDGTKMYLAGSDNNYMREWELSTAWDITTSTYNLGVDIANASFNMNVSFNEEGSKMLVTDQGTDAVFAYNINQWTLSSASGEVNFSYSSITSNPLHTIFNSDGTKMYMISSTDGMHQFSLSTAFNVTTASADTIPSSFASLSGRSLYFDTTGGRFYMMTGSEIQQWSMRAAGSSTWPTSIQWAGSATPPATGIGEKDIYTFTTDDGGTTYHGYRTADNLS